MSLLHHFVSCIIELFGRTLSAIFVYLCLGIEYGEGKQSGVTHSTLEYTPKTKRRAFFFPPLIQTLSMSRARVQIDGVIISAVMPLITHVKVTAGRYGTCCATRCQVIIQDD